MPKKNKQSKEQEIIQQFKSTIVPESNKINLICKQKTHTCDHL